MPGPTIKSLLGARSGYRPVIQALIESMGTGGAGLSILDTTGKVLLGDLAMDSASVPVNFEGVLLGSVAGPAADALALATLLVHLIAREFESRSLAGEVLHLYREIHLIEGLSEQLAALLNLPAVCDAALKQAQRLIHATHGGILVMQKPEDPLSVAACFCTSETAEDPCPLRPNSRLAAAILESGIAEIINDCTADPRAFDLEHGSPAHRFQALVCAPLRAGQRTVGLIALATTDCEPYAAADLKLLNTIALQTAAAIANALLAEEMVDAARVSTELAAELHAARTVQQLLLQSASRPTPGFEVESVYVPASEVGGDFFFVSSAPDGSLLAILGDVSGKGLTAAMRVAMILGVLRRETSHNPDEILSALNNALVAPGHFGFTTACCVRVSPSGGYTLANAGHIAPYLSGRELETPPSLPLGVAPDQAYELVHGTLSAGERLVLLSDGVPEARSNAGELYGFERLAGLTSMSAHDIAHVAQGFGQEDDISVLTLLLKPV